LSCPCRLRFTEGALPCQGYARECLTCSSMSRGGAPRPELPANWSVAIAGILTRVDGSSPDGTLKFLRGFSAPAASRDELERTAGPGGRGR